MAHALATDISTQMLSIARKRAIEEQLEGIIDFKVGDMQQWTYQNQVLTQHYVDWV